ncbi:hypothetical protein [Streptomyces poonensis]|nr:hypothetical protein [Streptomyces poonensis]
MNSAAVAYTTEDTATQALERQGHDVRWMTCKSSYDRVNDPNRDGNEYQNTDRYSSGDRYGSQARYQDDDAPRYNSSVQEVDCKGETIEGQPIRIYGTVSREIDGRCVRGDLTARVDDRQVFRADVLGDCDSRGGDGWNTPPANDNPGNDNPGNDNPGDDNPGDDNPGDDNPGDDNPGDDNGDSRDDCPDATETVWCKEREDCWGENK